MHTKVHSHLAKITCHTMTPRAAHVIVCVVLLALTSTQVWAWNDTHYRAAVLEFMPVTAKTFKVTVEEARAVMDQNIASYERFIAKAKYQGADIIVFPEYGLYGPNFPNRDSVLPYLEAIPNAGANPCTELEFYPYLNITYKLSCLAKNYEIVLAVDMGDVQYCTRWDTDCPKDKRYQFNTLVIFGTNGEIMSKYHKTNLYYEPEFDVPSSQYPVAFDLFGEKFGMIICFDIMFAKPQLELLDRDGVTNLIFSSWWVNTPPILTATQIQQGWSRAFNMNMLASNSGYNVRTSGSGIFSKGSALASFTNPSRQPRNRMLIADVPKLGKRPENPEGLHLPNVARIETENLATASKPLILHGKPLRTYDIVGETITDRISVQGLSCSFTYRLASEPKLNDSALILYAASGYLTPLFPSIACGVATCPSENSQECITLLQRPSQSVIANQSLFSFISLDASYHDPKQLTIYPVSAKNEAELFSDAELVYSRNEDNSAHKLTSPSFALRSPTPVSLLHIGFLGRDLGTYL